MRMILPFAVAALVGCGVSPVGETKEPYRGGPDVTANLPRDLLQAIKDGNATRAKALIERGAQINYGLGAFGSNYNPLHLAVAEGQLAIVAMMLEKHRGAYINLETFGDNGKTPLVLARENGDVEMEDLLLKHGAKAKSGIDNLAVRISNLLFGELRTLKLMLKSGAEVNPWMRDRYFGRAVRDNNTELVQFFLAHGASVNYMIVRREYDSTPLTEAVVNGNYDLAELMITNGAYPNSLVGGVTALHKARTAKLVELLIEHGAEVNLKGEYGWTPLHAEACAEGSDGMETVQALLKHGADTSAENDRGRTPLARGEQCKNRKNNEQALQLLRAHMGV